MNNRDRIKILASALVANVFSQDDKKRVISWLANQSGAREIVRGFGNSKFIRQINLVCNSESNLDLHELKEKNNRVFYSDRKIGEKQILYKSPLPGELQARLSYESIADRFLGYLQKVHHIVVLNESIFHVQVFIPHTRKINFTEQWNKFITKVAFSADGYPEYKLPGLKHTLIQMLNSITLAGRGFSTLEVPIITHEQGNILAAWYFAVIKQVEKRQQNRDTIIKNITTQISTLQKQIETEEFETKELDKIKKEQAKHEKDLKSKQEMQAKESKKYYEYFAKGLNKLEQHSKDLQEVKGIEEQLKLNNLKKTQINKLQNQLAKLKFKLIFSERSVKRKQDLLQQSQGDPFKFIHLDLANNSQLQKIKAIAKPFTKTATDQINSTRGDIFTQCILEMYRLIELEKLTDPIPEPLFTEKPQIQNLRNAGDDGKDFCYSCGVALDSKNANWKVARFMFERPSQRRQSSNSEDRPYICSTCSVLAFASPLKLTDESIVLKIESKNNNPKSEEKLKDYLRMLTNKELNLSSGRYVILTSDRTRNGVVASEKLGQIQYALLKVASETPLEVLEDFKFNLVLQGNQSKQLFGRYLILLRGLMENYGQTILIKDENNKYQNKVNLKLGDAVRYVEQDSPYLAEYTLVRVSKTSNPLEMEKVRHKYWNRLKRDNDVNSKRKKLYQDVAALTGLTYAFAQYLESTVKSVMKPEDAAREVSKLIEQVKDPIAFCYYATLGDEKKTSVQARLYFNPDNSFMYEQTFELLKQLNINPQEREEKENGKKYLTLYSDDINRAYTYFADETRENNYYQEKDWNELTYNLKLSLYTRFPELVRKLKNKGDK